MKIKYKKADSSTSEREVVPIGFSLDHNSVLCVDISDYSGESLTNMENLLDEIRQEYISKITECDLKLRSFKLEGIQI